MLMSTMKNYSEDKKTDKKIIRKNTTKFKQQKF